MKKTIKCITNGILGLSWWGAFLILAGEPTHECVHPFLAQFIALLALALITYLLVKTNPETEETEK